MPSRPNVKRLARRRLIEGLVAALSYHDWARLQDGSYLDLGILVRRDAVSALARIEDPRAIDAISRGIDDDALPVRLAAVTALTQRSEPDVAPALARAYLISSSDGDETTRTAALEALVVAPASAVGLAAWTIVSRDGDGSLEEAERQLLGELAAAGASVAQVVVATLVDALAEERHVARERAVQGLVAVWPFSASALVEAMDDGARRACAAVALGRCGDGRALEVLIGSVSDPDPAVRRAAADALGELHDPCCAQALLTAARDDDHETRAAAARALNRLGPGALLTATAGIWRPASEAPNGQVEHEEAQETGGPDQLRIDAPAESLPPIPAPPPGRADEPPRSLRRAMLRLRRDPPR